MNNTALYLAFAVLGLAAAVAVLRRRREQRLIAGLRREDSPRTALAVRGASLPVQRGDHVGLLVSAFESETQALFERTTPVSEHTVMYSLIAMVVLAVALSAVVELDRVVTASGEVVTSAGELYVSPLDRAIIKEVLVHAGDVVKKGQTLATLDPTFTAADVAQLQQRVASDAAEVARRKAEVDDQPYAAITGDAYSTLQEGIWRQRQAEYRSSLDDFDARINGARATIVQAQRDIADYHTRVKLAERNENMNRNLRSQGYVTESASMQATDARVEMNRLLSTSESQLDTARHSLDSLTAQRAAYVEKWHSDTAAARITTQTDLDQSQEQLRKADKLNELVTLESPADAVVLNVGKVSQGSIAAGGNDQAQDPLFTLVPLSAALEADVRISSADIGFIQVGDPVQLKLDAYNFIRHGTAAGTIKTLSEGSFSTDEVTHTPVAPYFKARVAIDEVHLRNVPDNFRLIPGMTLDADVMVGHRTILSYLIEGTLRTGAEAMREPD
jgi:HlyD family type I secretion membrane fusion protein